MVSEGGKLELYEIPIKIRHTQKDIRFPLIMNLILFSMQMKDTETFTKC